MKLLKWIFEAVFFILALIVIILVVAVTGCIGKQDKGNYELMHEEPVSWSDVRIELFDDDISEAESGNVVTIGFGAGELTAEYLGEVTDKEGFIDELKALETYHAGYGDPPGMSDKFVRITYPDGDEEFISRTCCELCSGQQSLGINYFIRMDGFDAFWDKWSAEATVSASDVTPSDVTPSDLAA